MRTGSTKSIAMLWPTTLAGLLGSLVLAFAVLAGPSDAAEPVPQIAIFATR